MENSKKIINLHYIGYIKDIQGHLKYCESIIPQDDIIIEEIESMKKNDNCTVLDVQSLFTKSYPKNLFQYKYYDYLFPFSYSSAYVSGVSYPDIITDDEYKKKLKDQELYYSSDKYLLNYCDERHELNKLKKESDIKFKERVKELVHKKMLDYVKSLRESFSCHRFIYAYRYNSVLEEIKKECNVKMWSTDQIGWKQFEYIINNDITIYISSNFGYGSASYFYCNLKYKDIYILPYTDIVKYYYVQMTDFIRYTRTYELERDSWLEVFGFVVDIVNMAKYETERFIKVWIVNEVQEMMIGIREIMNKPEAVLERYLEVQSTDIDFYNIFRNCSTIDRVDYEVLPNEKVISFKAEKITGCLFLLDNLRRIEELAPIITPFIEEIEQMNLQIQPEIESHLTILDKDIISLKNTLKQLVKEIDILNTQLDIHTKAIELLRQELTKKGNEQRYGGWEYICLTPEAEKKYSENHPDYVSLNKEIADLLQQKTKLHEHIDRRKRFLKILQKCKQRINDFISAA